MTLTMDALDAFDNLQPEARRALLDVGMYDPLRIVELAASRLSGEVPFGLTCYPDGETAAVAVIECVGPDPLTAALRLLHATFGGQTILRRP